MDSYSLVPGGTHHSFSVRKRSWYFDVVKLMISPALPHKSVDDDFYKGHYIPGKSIVLANVWYVILCAHHGILLRRPRRNISQNEAEYPDPRDFRPERYLGPNPESNTDPKDFVFGFGRR